MTIPQGYKQTELGIIPEDWEVVNLGNIAKVNGRIGFRGYTVADLVPKGFGAITLSPSNIINNQIDYSNCTYISWYKYHESPEIKVRNGDILLVKTGSTFGKSAFVKDLPEKAKERLGIEEHEKNILVRIVLRSLERTLTNEECNEYRDIIYRHISTKEGYLTQINEKN